MESWVDVCMYKDRGTTSQQLPISTFRCLLLDLHAARGGECPGLATKSTRTPPTLGLPACALGKGI